MGVDAESVPIILAGILLPEREWEPKQYGCRASAATAQGSVVEGNGIPASVLTLASRWGQQARGSLSEQALWQKPDNQGQTVAAKGVWVF